MRREVSENTGVKLMSRKILLWLLATVWLTTVSIAEAQQQAKVAKIGELLFRDRPD